AITKVATEGSFSAVGDVVHYTILASNTGQIALSNVTVSDPSVSGLVCSPANGSSLAPGASMTCTATHTITQADLDAGHYMNTACVDDGAGGAVQACTSVDVPRVRIDTAQKLVIADFAKPTGFGTPTGTVTFQLFTSSNCAAGTRIYDSGDVPLTNGLASTNDAAMQPPALTANGTYYWLVSYSGDVNNLPSTSACGSEQTTVSGNTPGV